MRIPLDYYRILGVPTKATTAQITQAYRDRVAQLPRREHSDLAIQSRRNIIEQAFQVLSQTDKRAIYDHDFLDNTYRLESQSRIKLPFQSEESTAADEAETHSPAIAIDQGDFLGGLLLLLELGEYELVLKMVPPYLKGKSGLVQQGLFGAVEVVRTELILCLALAYLELSREQWQQGHYEAAADSGREGQKLLTDAGIFPGLRGEMQADLYRLRPYQVLELLSLSESEIHFRQKGLQLLQVMLDARGGIDGAGDDQSGLSMDDFLRFIQQLRSYLTVREQQDLFVAESKRPSAVSTYLAVYALLAGGFAERQPDLIVKAKELLLRLAKRQDVHLEQSICALLLGQTEEANQALELSQEFEAIAFIRENSQDAPDLLPGLCLYAEKWLQTEVFAHFRDLRGTAISLTEYFADLDVQRYLENLPAEPTAKEWSVVATEPAQPARQARLEPVANLEISRPERPQPITTTPTAVARPSRPAPPPPSTTASGSPTKSKKHRPKDKAKDKQEKKPKTGSRKPFPLLWVALAAGGVVVIIGLVQAIAAISNRMQTIKDPLQITLSAEPPIAIPNLQELEPEDTQTVAATDTFDEATAEKVIKTWLDAKVLAFGKDHDVTALEKILATPLLTTWLNGAKESEAAGTYRTYEHQLKIEAVEFDPAQPDVATVEAKVTEKADYYLADGTVDASRSYNSELTVRYGLVRQDDRWLIKSSQVL